MSKRTETPYQEKEMARQEQDIGQLAENQKVNEDMDNK